MALLLRCNTPATTPGPTERYIQQGQLTPHHDLAAGESPADYAQRMRAMEATVRELLAAAQADRTSKLDAGRVDTVFTGCFWGPRSCLTPPTLVSCARGRTAPSP